MKNEMSFLKYYTVEKEKITQLQNYNKQKLDVYGNLGTKVIDKLITRFINCEDIAVRWSCEGYINAPKYRMKIPRIGFIVTEKGLDQLLCYLENCRKEIAICSEYWHVSFHHGMINDGDTMQMISWSLNTFVTDERKHFIFESMVNEFDLFFKDINVQK